MILAEEAGAEVADGAYWGMSNSKVEVLTLGLGRERIVIGVLGAFALFVLLMVPLPSEVQRSWLLPVLEDAFHGPLFAAFACLVLWLFKGTPWRGYVRAWLLAAAVALTSEIVQALGSRDPSWHDVYTDLAGITCGLALYALVFDASVSLRRRVVLAATVVATVAWVMFPVGKAIAAWADREQRFPVLFDARMVGALGMTESMTDDADVRIGIDNDGVDAELLAGPLPGIVVRGFEPDWRGKTQLVIEMENRQPAPVKIEVHVRDWRSSDEPTDRFSAIRELPAGRGSLRFDLAEIVAGPAQRQMRLDEMMIVAVYRPEPSHGSFAIRSIRLE